MVVVYAVDETAEGVPFIVMEYIPGPSVAELLRERTRLAPLKAAEWVAQAADGLAAAHAAGLIHSDIKPANILIDLETERARIVDFGLALLPDMPSSIPEGAVIGTPSYMSPEQARGQGQVDDGLISIPSGRPSTRCSRANRRSGERQARVVHQVLEDDARPPRELNEAIPRDLETICLKTLAKEPRQRYPATADLAADLRRWLSGEPIAARPLGPIGRLVRWAQRNRRVAVLAATAFPPVSRTGYRCAGRRRR